MLKPYIWNNYTLTFVLPSVVLCSSVLDGLPSNGGTNCCAFLALKVAETSSIVIRGTSTFFFFKKTQNPQNTQKYTLKTKATNIF